MAYEVKYKEKSLVQIVLKLMLKWHGWGAAKIGFRGISHVNGPMAPKSHPDSISLNSGQLKDKWCD